MAKKKESTEIQKKTPVIPLIQTEVLEDGTVVDPHHYGCIAAYFIAVVYVIITFSLLRVQEALEDPFDGMGS